MVSERAVDPIQDMTQRPGRTRSLVTSSRVVVAAENPAALANGSSPFEGCATGRWCHGSLECGDRLV
jgi:hypothetical protein